MRDCLKHTTPGNRQGECHFGGELGLLTEQTSGQEYKQAPSRLDRTAAQPRNSNVFVRVVLACLAVAGIHYLTTVVQGTPRVFTVDRGPSPAQFQPDDDQVNTRIHMGSDDRLIVSSLDQGAQLHEVCISWSAECSLMPELLGSISEQSSIHVVTLEAAMARRTAVQQSDVCTEFVPLAATEHVTADGDEPVDGISNVESLRASRPFRLPRFTTRGDSGLQSAAATQQCIDRVMVCQQRAASAGVSVYASDVELSIASIQELLETTKQLSIWNRIHGPCEIVDIDGDRRLSIVVCELSDGKSNSDVPLFGCVRAIDFLEDDCLGGDIIYLDYRLLGTPALTAVLTHEMAHAAVFSRIRFWRNKGHVGCLLPAWLNESIAHSCEFRRCPTSSNLADRISAYLSDTGRWPLMPSQRGFNTVSARGPVRAAGLFYVEFLRQLQTLDVLIDAEVRNERLHTQAVDAVFAEAFRGWTVWMSDQEQSGKLPLVVRALPEAESAKSVAIRGTAATWWQADCSGVVEISTHDRCKLQLTVVRAPAVDVAVQTAQRQLRSPGSISQSPCLR